MKKAKRRGKGRRMASILLAAALMANTLASPMTGYAEEDPLPIPAVDSVDGTEELTVTDPADVGETEMMPGEAETVPGELGGQ